MRCGVRCGERRGVRLGQHRHVQVDCPVVARRFREAADRVSLAQVFQRLRTLARHLALHQRQVATNVDNKVDVFDQHRALLHAGAAGGARPDGVGVDQSGHDGQTRRAAVGAGALARMRRAGVGSVALAGQAADHVLDQFFRIERLAGGQCRAGRLAFAALDAGVELQQAVPRKVGRLGNAEVALVKFEQAQIGRALAFKTLLARMEGQIEQAGKRMLHRAAHADAKRQFGRAKCQQRGHQQRRRLCTLRRQPGGQSGAKRKSGQRERQAHPWPAREPGRRRQPAPGHQRGAEQHQARRAQQHPVKQRRVQREAVVDSDDQDHQHRAAGHRHVGARNKRLARDDVVQVDKITLRDRQQRAQLDLCCAAVAPQAGALRQTNQQQRHAGPERHRQHDRQHVRSPCTGAANRRSRRGCCASRCSRPPGTAGSRRPPVHAASLAAVRPRTACAHRSGRR